MFKIGYLKLTSPSGGEIIKAGSNMNITWKASGVDNVVLYYSADNGLKWNIVANYRSASAGVYTWTVPNIFSSKCLIRISDIEYPECVDSSKISFRIWCPVVSKVVAGLGQTKIDFGDANIKLSAFVVVSDSISVRYYPYEKPGADSLPSGISSMLKCYWTMNSHSISFIDGLLSTKILELLDTATDSLKLVWLMRSNADSSWINIGGKFSAGELTSTVAVKSLSDFAIGIADNSSAVENKKTLPSEYSLSQNYPNPFNPSTKISYQLPEAGYVTIKVYDILGREVAKLADCYKKQGFYAVDFDTRNLSSGTYIYELRVNNYRAVRKMLLLK